MVDRTAEKRCELCRGSGQYNNYDCPDCQGQGVIRTVENEVCPHGYDKRLQRCVQCEDPAALTAAARPAVNVFHGSTGGTPLPSETICGKTREGPGALLCNLAPGHSGPCSWEVRPSNERVHRLKCWPSYFAAVLGGVKTFELRLNDRGYAVGDLLVLQEYSLTTGYSGRECRKRIGYMLTGPFNGLPEGYSILSFAPETESPQAPIAKVTIDKDGMVQRTGLYAPGLPPGEHDLYCEPEAVAPYMRAPKATEKRCLCAPGIHGTNPECPYPTLAEVAKQLKAPAAPEWTGVYVDDETGRAHKMQPWPEEKAACCEPAATIEPKGEWHEIGCRPNREPPHCPTCDCDVAPATAAAIEQPPFAADVTARLCPKCKEPIERRMTMHGQDSYECLKCNEWRPFNETLIAVDPRNEL